jgi:hypothetical protein
MNRRGRSIASEDKAENQAVLASERAGSGMTVTLESRRSALTLFISCQSYGNSLPQSRHTTYVPVTAAAGERREPRAVIGKL